MKNVNAFLQNIILLIILGLIVGVAIFVVRGIQKNEDEDKIVVPAGTNTPSLEDLEESATEMSEAGEPIPTIEYSYIQKGDLVGLQKHLNENAKNWENMSVNIHSVDVNGVSSSSETISTIYCSSPYKLLRESRLCWTATVEYTAVYKAILTGGVEINFLLHPTLTFKGDWEEIDRVTSENKVEVIMGSTVIITYSGNMCVTSVEERTPTAVNDGEEVPNEDSYTFKTRDERLFLDVGSYQYDNDINEEALRLDAYRKAKAIALQPENVLPLYNYILDDMRPAIGDLPAGKLRQAIEDYYTPELAKLFGVKGFEIVMQPSPGDPLVRCDGSNVNQ